MELGVAGYARRYVWKPVAFHLAIHPSLPCLGCANDVRPQRDQHFHSLRGRSMGIAGAGIHSVLSVRCT